MGGDSLDMTARCIVCGDDLGVCRSDKIYCSRKCANAYHNGLRRADLIESKRGRLCVVCGGAVPVTKKAHAKTCCAKCQNRESRNRAKG